MLHFNLNEVWLFIHDMLFYVPVETVIVVLWIKIVFIFFSDKDPSKSGLIVDRQIDSAALDWSDAQQSFSQPNSTSSSQCTSAPARLQFAKRIVIESTCKHFNTSLNSSGAKRKQNSKASYLQTEP